MRAMIPGLLAAWLLLGCATVRVHERAWVEVRTANFTVWSCQREAKTLELARELELFRSVVEFVVGEKLPTSPVPVHVYAFDTTYTYTPFAIEGAAGYFEQSLRENTVVVAGRSVSRADTTQVIQHEYVHFLLENHGDFVYPRWYHEGFAEFLGSVRSKGSQVVIGSVPAGRIPTFESWIPVEKLLGLKPGMRISLYSLYAQSWALVHYLNFGRETENRDTTRRELTRYFRARESGSPVAEAVQRGFGTSVYQLDSELGRYVRRGRYNSYYVDADTFDPGEPPQLRALQTGEVAILLGQLSLARERDEQALAYFNEASRLRPEDARAARGLGAAREALGRYDQAEPAYRAAIALAPNDALTHLDLANFLHGRAAAAKNETSRARLAASARAEYVASWKLDDSIPETYARYGETYLLAGQEPGLGLETLGHAYALLPSSVKIRIDLARLHLALGQTAAARKLALSAAATIHSEDDTKALEDLLARTSPGGA